MRRVIFWCVVIGALAGRGSAAPTIQWSTDTIAATVGNGSVASDIAVTFRSAENIRNVSIDIVPEIAPFLHPEPSQLTVVEANRDYTVVFHTSVGPYAVPGTYVGTVHLRTGSRTLARPLAAEISVAYGANVISPEARVLSDKTWSSLQSVSEDGRSLTFTASNEELARLGPGDVLVAPPAALLPDGFIGKISEIGESGSTFVVRTTVAAINDALVDADISVSAPAAPAAVVSAMENNNGLGHAKPSATSQPWFLEIDDVPLYDHDGDLNTTGDQVRATGRIQLDTSFSFAVQMRNAMVQSASFIADANAKASLEVTAAVFFEPTDPLKLYLYRSIDGSPSILPQPAIRLRPIVIWAGYVPIVLTPVLNVMIGLDGSVSVGMRATVTETAALTAGLTYADGTVTPVHDFSSSFEFDPPTAILEAQGKVFAGPQLDLLLYGLAGPNVAIDGFLELTVRPVDPIWELYGGLEARVGLKIYHLVDVDLPVISYRRLLAQAEPTRILLKDDFEDGLTTGWVTFRPGWFESNGVFHATNTSANQPVEAVWGAGYDWTDYTAEVDVRPLSDYSPSDVQLKIRYQSTALNGGPEDNVACSLFHYPQYLVLNVPGQPQQLRPFPFVTGQWYRLRASASGQTMTCEVVGFPSTFMVATSSGATHGTVGLRGTHIPADFDNLLVTRGGIDFAHHGATYTFDNINGSNVPDVSGSGNDATFIGAQVVAGHSGSALRFATSNDFVSVPPSVYAGWTNKAYFEAWVRPAAYPTDGCLGTIFRKRAPFNDWELDVMSDGSLTTTLYDQSHSSGVGIHAGFLPLSSWSKVATYYDGAAMHLYVNDAEIATTSKTIVPDWTGGYIGTEIGNDHFDTGVNCPDYVFRGDIDDVVFAPAKP